MGEPCEILVLVDENTAPHRVIRIPPDKDGRVEVCRWDRVRSGELLRRSLRAVVFEPGMVSRERRRRREILRTLPEDVARISLLARKGSGDLQRRRQGRPQVTAPLDLKILFQLIAKERERQDLEAACRRSRRRAVRASRQLRTLVELTRVCNSDLEPRRIIQVAMEQVARWCPYRSWSVFLIDEHKNSLVLEADGGPSRKGRAGCRLGLHTGLAGRVAQSRAPILLTSSRTAGTGSPFPDLPIQPWFQVLGLPLLSRGGAMGVVELIRERGQRPFRPGEIRTLQNLLEPVAIAIENALLLRKSEALSVTDDLTGLYNSRYLNSSLSREVQRCRRYGTTVSLLFLDLDGFKTVNDRFGHLAGSRALVEVGSLIRNTLREIDVVSRFGGDEFTVILPQTALEGAKVIAERIRRRIEEAVFLRGMGLQVSITASLGIASFPDHADGKDTLIQRADQAMYRVKGSGKNGVAVADRR